MKKILSIVLALALVLSVAAASADIIAGKTFAADIEGIPELPSIPSMTTKNDDHTAVISLSEELGWLNVVSNWQWLDIITWDGPVGTYSLDEDAFAKLQPGFGEYHGRWYGVPYAIERGLAEEPKLGNGDDCLYPCFEYPNPDDPTTYIVRVTKKELDGTWAVLEQWTGRYSGNYELGFTYDGATKDGVGVRYDAWGKLVQATIPMNEVNFFGEEEAPALTNVIYWAYEPLPWVHQISLGRIESRDADGNLLHYAEFASNGKCLRVH